MYNPDTPHGNPGVQVAIDPPAQFPLSVGPLYFNEQVQVDATLTSTSVDGGVFFGNLPAGRQTITASKAPFSYDALMFSIQDGIALYVASPPHATQGTNSSPASRDVQRPAPIATVVNTSNSAVRRAARTSPTTRTAPPPEPGRPTGADRRAASSRRRRHRRR